MPLPDEDGTAVQGSSLAILVILEWHQGRLVFSDCNFLCSTIPKDPSWNGISLQHISYNDVLARRMNICSIVLDREGCLGTLQ
jgi:hypothetical protein